MKKERKKEKEQDDQTTTRERITRDPNISDEKEKAGRDHLVLDVDAVIVHSIFTAITFDMRCLVDDCVMVSSALP